MVLLIHLLLPHGILFSEIRELAFHSLPWGEVYALPVGPASPWRLLADLSGLALIALVLDTSIRLIRRGPRRRGLLLGSGLALLMGLDLAWDVVRAGRLSREVVANEHRWRTLLENVSLLVTGLNRQHRIDYANPYFLQMIGFEAGEVMGRGVIDFVAPADRETVSRRIDDSLAGRPDQETRLAVLTRDGQDRTIAWRTVALKDVEGRISGVLSVGIDVTDQLEAEADRDRALTEVTLLKSRLEEENVYLKEEVRATLGHLDIVGESDAIKYVLHRIKEVASTDTTVLVEGETGVGKELVAHAIHEAGPRSRRPLIKVNCAGLPPGLVESELFGHEKGAFTGADAARKGRFELADGGTLFLDEVGELPLELQPKLLRVLQDGEHERVGGSRTNKVDVRVIAASNRDLRAEVAAGRFREDLFYCLHVYPITVPPLRDRRDDIPLLVEHFVPHLCSRVGREVGEVSSHALRRLKEHDWPGNVRELKNVLEQAIVACTDGVLRLPSGFGSAPAREPAATPEPRISLQDYERRYILEILEGTDGRIGGPGGASEILEIHPNTLRSRLKRLGIGKAS